MQTYDSIRIDLVYDFEFEYIITSNTISSYARDQNVCVENKYPNHDFKILEALNKHLSTNN